MKNQTGAKATIGLAFLTLISKILGFVREIVISYMYGASAISDAYSMANSVAVLIVTGFASGIMTAYIPTAMGMTEEVRNKFTSNVLNVVVATTSVVVLICVLFSHNIVDVLGMGFAESTKEYTVIILRFVFVAAICIFIIYIITAFLNTKGNFSFGGMQLVITNLLFIFAVIISGDNPWYLGIGYLLAYIIPTVLAICLAKKYGFAYSKETSLKDIELKKLLIVSVIAFLGTNVIKFDVMLDRIFASNLQEGTVAAVNYAFTLISIFPEVLILSMATVGYPKLSAWHNEKNDKAFGDFVSSLLIQTLLLLAPIVIIFLQLGKWAIEIMFQRGAFSASDTLLTTDILSGYSFSMLGIGISYILCRAFFARKEEWIPATCLGTGIILNLVLNIVWGKNSAYELALTTSISVTISTLLMLVTLYIKIKKINIAKLVGALLKILISVIVMWSILNGGVNLFSRMIEQGEFVVKIILVASIAVVSGMTYIVALYVLRVDEIKTFMQRFLKRLKKGN